MEITAKINHFWYQEWSYVVWIFSLEEDTWLQANFSAIRFLKSWLISLGRCWLCGSLHDMGESTEEKRIQNYVNKMWGKNDFLFRIRKEIMTTYSLSDLSLFWYFFRQFSIYVYKFHNSNLASLSALRKLSNFQ